MADNFSLASTVMKSRTENNDIEKNDIDTDGDLHGKKKNFESTSQQENKEK